MVWQPTRSERYRILIALGFGVLLLVVGLGVAASTTQPAHAQVQVGDLSVSGTNQTVDGTPSDVTLSADLTYSTNVPDATMRVVELRAGPSKDNLETLTFKSNRDPSGTDSGTVTLSGSLLDTAAYSAEGVGPDMAETKQTDVVVAATIKIDRENGETLTRTVTESTTLTLEDDTDLSADLGGTVDVTVTS